MIYAEVRDISTRKCAEAQLKALNEELERRVSKKTADLLEAHGKLVETQFAMDRVGIGITWTDVETGRFTFVNRYYADFLGYTPEEMLGLSVPDIIPTFPPEAFSRGGNAGIGSGSNWKQNTW